MESELELGMPPITIAQAQLFIVIDTNEYMFARSIARFNMKTNQDRSI